MNPSAPVTRILDMTSRPLRNGDAARERGFSQGGGHAAITRVWPAYGPIESILQAQIAAAIVSCDLKRKAPLDRAPPVLRLVSRRA